MKKVLITGASEGIGRAMVKKWISEGYSVTGIARNEIRLKELKTEFEGKFDFVVADLSKSIEPVVKVLDKHHFNVFINNAGFGIYSDFAEQPIEKINEMLSLNIVALTNLSHAYLKTAQAGDVLINVSSVLSFLPMPVGAVYSASKAYVTSFSESLWSLYKPKDVYVCALCPGSTESEFFARANANGSKPPPKAMMQTAEQVADIAYMATHERDVPTVICGNQNKAIVLSARVMSRKALVTMMSKSR